MNGFETGDTFGSIDWRPIVAGAAVASGLSIPLLAFGPAIGPSLASSAPTWRAVMGGASHPVIASDLDDLFRTDRNVSATSLDYHRAEASRLLLKSATHPGISTDDRAYLGSVVSSEAGLTESDAAGHVERVIGSVALGRHRARRQR